MRQYDWRLPRPGQDGKRAGKIASMDDWRGFAAATAFQYVSDQPTTVIVSTSNSIPVLTRLNVLPWPSRWSRDSGSMQRRTVTNSTTLHASMTGTPGCRPIISKNCDGGWPAGIHQGSSGATPAASENVSSLRVNQPLTFGRASFHPK